MKKTWCPACVGFVEYRTEEDMRNVEFDGIKARYNRKAAVCPKCDTVLSVSDIINQNVRARIEALNREAGYESKKTTD